MRDYTQLNGLALAYVGDAIYEIYVRDHLIDQGETKPNKLHRAATNYVSANAQAFLIQQMLEEHLLTEEEELYYRRGRNAKSHTSAKNADDLKTKNKIDIQIKSKLDEISQFLIKMKKH